MGVRCSLFGHKYEEQEVDRKREEDGDEVVISMTEYTVCTRCGHRDVVAENTEVTSQEERSVSTTTEPDTEPDDGGAVILDDTAGAGNDDSPPETGPTPTDATAESPASNTGAEEPEVAGDDTDTLPADAAKAPAADASPNQDTSETPAGDKEEITGDRAVQITDAEDDVRTSPDNGGSSDAEGDGSTRPESDSSTRTESDGSTRTEGDGSTRSKDAVNTGAEDDTSPHVGDSDEAAGETAKATSNGEEDGGEQSGFSTDWPERDEVPAEEAEVKTGDHAKAWPDQTGSDEGFDSKRPSEDTAAEPDIGGGTLGTGSGVDSGGGVGPSGEEPVPADAGTESAPNTPESGQRIDRIPAPSQDEDQSVLRCPECDYVDDEPEGSRRRGDICPACHKGYLATAERNR